MWLKCWKAWKAQNTATADQIFSHECTSSFTHTGLKTCSLVALHCWFDWWIHRCVKKIDKITFWCFWNKQQRSKRVDKWKCKKMLKSTKKCPKQYWHDVSLIDVRVKVAWHCTKLKCGKFSWRKAILAYKSPLWCQSYPMWGLSWGVCAMPAAFTIHDKTCNSSRFPTFEPDSQDQRPKCMLKIPTQSSLLHFICPYLPLQSVTPKQLHVSSPPFYFFCQNAMVWFKARSVSPIVRVQASLQLFKHRQYAMVGDDAGRKRYKPILYCPDHLPKQRLHTDEHSGTVRFASVIHALCFFPVHLEY